MFFKIQTQKFNINSIIFPPQTKDGVVQKSIKPPPSKKPPSPAKSESKSKLKNQIKKVVKQSPKHKVFDDLQKEGETDSDKKSPPKVKQKVSSKKKANGSVKRKKTRDDEKGSDKNVVTKKRMASLNASAILSANYEIENYAAKHESSSSESSDNDEGEEDNEKDDVEPPTMKKEKKDVKMESEEVFLLLCYLFVSFVCTVSSPKLRRFNECL